MSKVIKLAEAKRKDVAHDGDDSSDETDMVTGNPDLDPAHVRTLEALLFASKAPVDELALKAALPKGTNVAAILAELQRHYRQRGVNLVKLGTKWQFRTAADLAFLLRKETQEERRLSRAALETLAIIAYHQPVTRAEIEDIRGVMVSKGTVDALMEVGWIRIRGRRRVPGRPITYGTTDSFLEHFGLESVGDLPGMDELKAAGFLEAMPPTGFGDMPMPSAELAPDEDPYEGGDEELPETGDEN